jgi:hypothetical protein
VTAVLHIGRDRRVDVFDIVEYRIFGLVCAAWRRRA